MSDRRFVWFAPNAGNWVTYRMEHRVANALIDSGEDVLMLQCDRVLNAYCQVMSPAGLTATSPAHEKAAVCRSCRFAAGIARGEARYATEQLSHFLRPEDWSWVDDKVASTDFDNWDSIEIGGLPVGRYASYTTMLHHKRATVSQTPESWQEYLADLRGALLVARALPRLVDEARPTHAVVYNALYPANRVFAEGLTRAGAVLMNLSGGPTVPRRYSTLAVYDGIKASQTMTDSNAFRASMQVPASGQEIMHVEEHVAQLMSGADPWVYSSAASLRPAREVRALLGVRPQSSVATVIVSSPDETRSNLMVDAEFHRDPTNGYSDVAEFLRACIALAHERPEVDFVFRLHPRLAPNKRERLVSPDLGVIIELLADLPPNAVINSTADGLSLYDLLLVSSLAVNQSSSAGLEFQVFGVPVVQYDPVRQSAYPPDPDLSATRDVADLIRVFDRALLAGADPSRSILAFRWYVSGQMRAVVHLDPLDPVRTGPPTPTQPEAPASSHPLGRFLPARAKEFIAARIQRHQRARELADLPPLSADATRVLLTEIDHVTGSGDVWEPFMNYPPASDAGPEEAAVHAAVLRLSERLALNDLDGVGVVAWLAVSAD